MKVRPVFLSTLLFFLALTLAGCSNNLTPTTSPVGQPAPTAAADPLPSWNDGPAKQAILDFVKTTTDKDNPKFVPPEDRIATFDQDGTTWVEHPMYSQVMFALTGWWPWRRSIRNGRPRCRSKPCVTGDQEAIAKFTLKDVEDHRLGDAHRHDGRGVSADREGVARNGEASALG